MQASLAKAGLISHCSSSDSSSHISATYLKFTRVINSRNEKVLVESPQQDAKINVLD